ncbi:MAG: ABC transporter permease, partial [Gammaproteobacteria bacterium]|nr:ABC transporter permease [Gammaproteobacteria bacterium]
MIGRLEWFIGLRYWGTGRGRGLVSFISGASLLGIALGVAALIIILSAMNGLEAESRNRLLSMADHITVRTGPLTAGASEDLRRTLLAADGVDSVAPFVRLEVLLVGRDVLRPVLLRGVDPAAERESELARIVGADALAALVPGSGRIVVGQFVAAGLGVVGGD